MKISVNNKSELPSNIIEAIEIIDLINSGAELNIQDIYSYFKVKSRMYPSLNNPPIIDETKEEVYLYNNGEKKPYVIIHNK